MMILKMLSEGKITLEEADALLEALELTEKSENYKNKEKSVIKDSTIKEEIELMEDEIERMEDELEKIEDELDNKLDELEDRLDELKDMEKLNEDYLSEMQHRLNEVRQKLIERKERVKERRRKLKENWKVQKEKFKRYGGISFAFQEGLEEIKKGFQELKKSFQGEGMEEIKSAMRDLADSINEGMRELKENLDEGAKEVQKAFHIKDFKHLLNNIIKSFGFNTYINLEEEITGTFNPEQGPVIVDLKTHNGRIEVVGSDETDYRLQLKYHIPTDSKEKAEKLKEEMCTISQTPTLFQLKTNPMNRSGVSVRLYIPKNLQADFKLQTSNGRIYITGLKQDGKLDLKSSNGRLELVDLRVKEIEGHTSNGRIEIKDFAADRVNVNTSNGSIYLEGLCDQVDARTSNGTITACPYISEKGNLNLNTSNGKIKIEIRDPEVGVDLDLTSSMGSMTLDIPDLVYQEKIENPMWKRYLAQSKDYIVREKRIQIHASTSMGSIYVGQSKEEACCD